MDAEGCIWVAIFGKGEVRRYSPEGELLRTIEVQNAAISSCHTVPFRAFPSLLTQSYYFVPERNQSRSFSQRVPHKLRELDHVRPPENPGEDFHGCGIFDYKTQVT